VLYKNFWGAGVADVRELGGRLEKPIAVKYT